MLLNSTHVKMLLSLSLTVQLFFFYYFNKIHFILTELSKLRFPAWKDSATVIIGFNKSSYSKMQKKFAEKIMLNNFSLTKRDMFNNTEYTYMYMHSVYSCACYISRMYLCLNVYRSPDAMLWKDGKFKSKTSLFILTYHYKLKLKRSIAGFLSLTLFARWSVKSCHIFHSLYNKPFFFLMLHL